MSHARTTALLCACALVANAAADAAPAPPRTENKGSKMVHDDAIVVRRVPNAYFYPFSLWPLPKYSVREHEEIHEALQYKMNYNIRKRQNER